MTSVIPLPAPAEDVTADEAAAYRDFQQYRERFIRRPTHSARDACRLAARRYLVATGMAPELIAETLRKADADMNRFIETGGVEQAAVDDERRHLAEATAALDDRIAKLGGQP